MYPIWCFTRSGSILRGDLDVNWGLDQKGWFRGGGDSKFSKMVARKIFEIWTPKTLKKSLFIEFFVHFFSKIGSITETCFKTGSSSPPFWGSPPNQPFWTGSKTRLNYRRWWSKAGTETTEVGKGEKKVLLLPLLDQVLRNKWNKEWGINQLDIWELFGKN